MIDWAQYEQDKRAWVEAHPAADPQEYQQAMREIASRHECKHQRKELRWRDRTKSKLIGYQCLDCKGKVGDWVKHSSLPDPGSLADWEEPPPYLPAPRDALPTPEESRAAYQQYLQSPQWRELRAKVMNRAGGRCEGCLAQSASEVHHTTYRNIYDEFAFELVALCRNCHARIHDKEAA